MSRWILIAVLTGTLLSGTAAAEAAPVSGEYKQFVESLDTILSGAVIPIAEEQDMAVGRPG